MADAGLFIGWGANIAGREETGLEVFSETLAYYGGLQQEGRIESFETVLLGAHGGDLDGFILLRGSSEQMLALRADEGFERMTIRAQLVVENVGVVDAILGGGLEGAIERYRAAIDDIV